MWSVGPQVDEPQTAATAAKAQSWQEKAPAGDGALLLLILVLNLCAV